VKTVLKSITAATIVALLSMAPTAAVATERPFEDAIEVGRSIEPGGSMPFGFINLGLFDTYPVRGNLTRHVYRLPLDRARTDVFEDIEDTLDDDDFTVIVSHKPKNADSETIHLTEEHFFREFDGRKMVFTEDKELISFTHDPSQQGGFYLSAMRHDPGKDTYAVVTISNARNFVQVDVVEVVHRVIPTMTTTVTVAEEVATPAGEVEIVETLVLTKDRIHLEIETHGHINIYGILFGIDSATIQPRSQMTLDVVAEYLKLFPQHSYYVIGHTSDTGAFDHNMKLSVDRATAVIDTLVKGYAIDARRLTGFGVGPVAPVDSNFSSLGRAHNRRVVLIKRLPGQ
jgi:outer membrane protein OmpA-like peptidoglycan-associated protein